jgi:Dolichyl-phosphate-mannose-protein mannosyltransferase
MAGNYSHNLRPALVLLPFIVVILLIDGLSMYNMSLTWDEWDHVDFGKSVWERTVSGASMQKMPITVLNYLPYRISAALGLDPAPKTAAFLSRLPSVLASLLLAAFVCAWASRLYGTRGALVALTLYAFCPNTIAHSRLATTDIYCACSMFIALFVFVDYLRRPRTSAFVVSAVALGIAQVTKSTALLLFPLFVFLWLVKGVVLKPPEDAPAAPAPATPRRPRLARAIAKVLAFLAVVLLVMNAAYLFQGSFAPLPLPRAFVEAVRLGMRYNATGEGHAPVYLLGKLSQRGWWYYFPVAFGLKTPLALFPLLVMASLVAKPYIKRYPLDEIALISAAVAIFTFFTFFCTAQIGVRYLLPVYPLVYVFIGKVALHVPARGARAFRAAVLGLVLWFAASSLSFFPHYISYFNEVIGDRKNMYKYLADSNVDWRQDAYYLQAYLDKHKGEAIHVDPRDPTSGTVIMSVNALVARDGSAETTRWLRDNFKPVGRIGYSMLIYDISPEELSSKLAK